MKKIASAVIGITMLGITLGLIYYSTACPCDRIPGIALWGDEVTEPVSDWQFANEAGLCQLQVSNGIVPQSLNLNCMSGNGELFISCARCDGKRWSTTALNHPDGRIRINQRVYPVTLKRVVDPAQLDFAWLARANKLKALGREASIERPDHWWSFKLTSAPNP